MRRLTLTLFVVLAMLLPAIPVAAAPAPPRSPFCDPIDTQQCLLPFPDNFYTVTDATSATGRRLHFPPAAMPKNTSGVPIDPTDWNRQDGFSPGSAVMVRIPNLDLARTGIAP